MRNLEYEAQTDERNKITKCVCAFEHGISNVGLAPRPWEGVSKECSGNGQESRTESQALEVQHTPSSNTEDERREIFLEGGMRRKEKNDGSFYSLPSVKVHL